jgi:hypothetical protein
MQLGWRRSFCYSGESLHVGAGGKAWSWIMLMELKENSKFGFEEFGLWKWYETTYR